MCHTFASRPATTWGKQRQSWKLGLEIAKAEFTVQGRMSVAVKFIDSQITDRGRISSIVILTHPDHKNSFLDESYLIVVGRLGKLDVTRLGTSLGGTKRKLA